MGESTDSGTGDSGEALSDESIEAQERGQDISQSQGYASNEAEASYNQAQNAIAQQIAQGQQLGAGLNNVQA